jgi:imidazole glycerol-phosphate synthase subunit HisF
LLKNRVIPTLLIQEEGLVKTFKFNTPKYVGDPLNAIKIFNDKEVDELIVLDIDASQLNRGPNYGLIEQFASECFMPLCYGGGIRTLEQAKKLFSLGIEKISIQSEAYTSLGFIKKLSDIFGSQSIVVMLDIKKNWMGSYKLYSSRSHKILDKDWLEFLQSVVEMGAGEVVINSVDRDGTLSGIDLDLIKMASEIVNIPIIASGGVGSLNDIKLAVDNGASAVAVGAYFVFKGPRQAVLITYPKYSDLETLFTS